VITLTIYQGSAFSTVLQAKDRSGEVPMYFLPDDVLTASVWNGQTQSELFAPTIQWFMGLADITVTSGGSGYIAPPITISGGGATEDATARATVIGGTIAEIDITSPGDQYTSAPTIAIGGVGVGAAAIGTPALGWQTGQVAIQMSAEATALLETMGQYRFRATVQRQTPLALIDCLIRVMPSPGAATQLTLTYNSYQDMLDIAPWIAGVQDVDVDQEGYYSQRLKARLWFDDIVLQRFQGGYSGQYGAHSNDFGSGGGSQWLGPDPLIRDYLAANKLVRTPAVVQACAHYAVAQVGIAQLGAGGGASLARWGQYHLAKANRDVLAIVAQIDADGDGIGELQCNLSTIGVTYG
jgi:hypothetical protein